MTASSQHIEASRFHLLGFFKLVRGGNLLILAFTQYMVKFFLIDEAQSWRNLLETEMLLLTFSTLCIAAAGYIINDYYDIKIDTVNKPERVVVGRLLRRRVALGAHFVLNITGIALGAWLSLKIAFVSFWAGFFLWLYSNQLKRLPLVGNVTIALLAAVSVLMVGLHFPNNWQLVWLFALFAFFLTIIREIVKDMEDVKGDASFGCRTLPIVWGIRRSKQVVYVFLSILGIILLSTYLSFPSRFAFYLYLFVLPPLFWFLYRLLRADTRRDFRFLSRLCKAIMLLGVLSMVMI